MSAIILLPIAAAVATGTAVIVMWYLGGQNGNRRIFATEITETTERNTATGFLTPRRQDAKSDSGIPVSLGGFAPLREKGDVDEHSVNSVAENPTAVFSATSLRLRREISALSRRGNLNLTIGVITTGFAMGLLAYMIFDESRSADTVAAELSHYIPRVTTVTFIEVFSFFFLRLYRTSLQEIKFYQNELTSLAGQQIALETSRQTPDPQTLRQVLSQIAKHNPNSYAESAVASRQASVGSADDANLSNAMNLLERVGTLAAAGAKIK
jgi:hypothetical protein